MDLRAYGIGAGPDQPRQDRLVRARCWSVPLELAPYREWGGRQSSLDREFQLTPEAGLDHPMTRLEAVWDRERGVRIKHDAE